jgi:hypothetical protein
MTGVLPPGPPAGPEGNAITPETLARLQACGITIASETATHYLLTRENCLVLVARTGSGSGSIGSTGIVTASGVAFPFWRDGRWVLAAKGGEVEATADRLAAMEHFQADVKRAFEPLQ